MRFSFRSDPEETFRAMGAVGEITNKGHRIDWAAGAAIFVSLLIAMRLWPEKWIPLAILLAVHTLLVIAALFFEMRIRIKRHIAADPATAKDLDVEIDDAGIRSHRSDARSEAGWSAIRTVHETPDFYLFFFNPFAAQWIPKRVVGAAEAELRALIRLRSPDGGANLQSEGSTRR